ncbi:MAG: prepilin-type N-terminal cleavage/methylation domain-containing protein [Deltaproteobacteria bacterium]|nr:prepilin-type N-terminal cleavage/methylation domain-containing protein [Deltaproteobacteria bacterium]
MEAKEMNSQDRSGKRIRAKKEEGFTLLEAIFAISILTIGLLSLASMQVSTIKGNAFASGVTEATSLAADRLEKILALPFDHSDLSAGNHTDPDPPIGYSIGWNVVDDSPLNDTKTVNITVSWVDRGALRQVSVQRVVPRMK